MDNDAAHDKNDRKERRALSPHQLVYSPTETAEILGCSRAKVYLMIRSGELPHVRIGGMTKVPAGRLRALVAA